MVKPVSIQPGREKSVTMFYDGDLIVKYRLRRNVVIFIILGLVLWLVGIFVTPILATSNWSWGQKISAFMYFFYKPVCHQISERSFLLNGHTLAVCVRCFSFYLGGLLVTSIYIFKDKIYMWTITSYIFFVLPALLDFLLEKIDFYTNIGGLRLLTGLLLGIAFFQLLLLSMAMNKRGING